MLNAIFRLRPQTTVTGVCHDELMFMASNYDREIHSALQITDIYDDGL